VRLLQEAASQTTHLVVALNSDLSIRSLKGVERPVGTYEVRRRKVLEVVPHATVVDFYNDPISLIELLTPDVIFKGADYADKPVRGAGTAPVVLVDLVPGVSTTQKIAEGVF
jgi:D-beta-D-heptose 7-phosphate kinase/D-beta-D-heptose 1-phosphate adenosyltransferase